MSVNQNLADAVIEPPWTYDFRLNSEFRKPVVSKRRPNTAEVGPPAVPIRPLDEVTVPGDAVGAGAIPSLLPARNEPPNHLESPQEVAERPPNSADDGNAIVPMDPTSQQASSPGLRMWMCLFEGCGQVFNKPNSLARHKQIHVQFKCDICNKTYQKNYYYRKHVNKCSEMYIKTNE